MTELTDSFQHRIKINPHYIVSIQELASWSELDGIRHEAQSTVIRTVDGSSINIQGTYDEVLKELDL